MAEPVMLNYFRDAMAARELGRDNAFRKVAGSAVNATDPAARAAAIGQAANIDPNSALALDKTLQAQDDSVAAKAAGAARYVLNAVNTGKPEAAEGAYQAVRPFLEKLGAAQGKVPPPNWSPEMLPMLHQVIAASQGAGTGSVASGFVSEDGYVYNRMRDGSVVNTGVKAEGKLAFRDQPGLTPGVVDLRSRTIAPITEAGAATAPPQPTGPVVAADGAPIAIDPSIPPAVAERIRASEVAGTPVPADMGRIDNAAPTGSGLTAARPAVSPAEAERLQLAREANQRAEEAAALARQTAADARAARDRGTAPQGMRFRADGSLEPIPGAGATGSEDERKAAGWFHQASRALTNMREALAEDPNADTPSAIEAYSPIDEVANRSRSAARQRYVNASSSAAEAILRAATGAGVNEQEARQKIAELTPQRGDTAEVKRQKMAGLEGYLGDLQTRAGRALQNTTPVVNPRPAPAAPQRGEVRRGYRYIGGDPSQRSSWEPVR